MKITGSTALFTGAGQGLGRHITQAFLERGAVRVYATARRPEAVDLEGAPPLALDVTDPGSVAAAAATDVDLLVNNAGVSAFTDFVFGDLDAVRLEMETNFFGPLQVVRALPPVLAAHGGGAILNVLSVLSWVSHRGAAGYAASKSAAWSMPNGVRLELADQGTQVTGFVMASTDTDMIAHLDVPKNDPAEVVRVALDGLESDELEVVADANSAEVKAPLSQHPRVLYPGVARPVQP